jgi:hypothetical protein
MKSQFRRMTMGKRFYGIAGMLFLMLCVGSLVPGPAVHASPTPRVEVVFCLDTTGSMEGLIEGAKQKIWSISNKIVGGEPTPDLYIGLVGYRDYGDQYVTRVHPLDDDLDRVYENLMSFRADGGGDTPEHVNRALHDAVHAISWSEDLETLKLLFLVGDCPPHMDYDDGFHYRDICQKAVRQDIIINTIQCGDYYETSKYWKSIARLGEGEYAAIAQEGGMSFIETPYDEELSRLNMLLEDTVVPYGSVAKRKAYEGRKEKVTAMAPSMAAERAAYKSVDDDMGAYDLIDALEEGSVELDGLKDRDLPPELRGMTLKEKQAYLKEMEEEREILMQQIGELSAKRSSYIAKKLEEETGEDSFDEVVQRFIEEQASDKGIRY